MRSTPILIKYLPHGLNHEQYFPITPEYKKYTEFLNFKKQVLNNKEFDFILFFNSRNIRRKQIPDTIVAFRLFLDKLTPEQAKKCCFLLHTEKSNEHGTDLSALNEYMFENHPNNIIIFENILDGEKMNWLYNIGDAQILLTDNEGWGLSLTEAMLCGKPIIANVQGGMQDQMRFEDKEGNWINFSKDFPSNHRGTYKNHGAWAFPVFPTNISIQGSPVTPYISSDRVRPEDAALQIITVYNLGKEERQKIGLLGRTWALSEEAGFTSENQGDRVIEAFDKLFETWKPREKFELININSIPNKTVNHNLDY